MHNLSFGQLLQTHQQSLQDLATLLNGDIFVPLEEDIQGAAFDVLHREIKGVLGFVDPMQGDTVWVFDPSHQFDFILNCCLPLSLEGCFLHESLDCYSAILAEIVSQVDGREVSSPDLPLRLEKLMKVFSRDVPQQEDLPFLAPRPEISLQSYLCFSKEELQPEGLSMFALDDRKVECKL